MNPNQSRPYNPNQQNNNTVAARPVQQIQQIQPQVQQQPQQTQYQPYDPNSDQSNETKTSPLASIGNSNIGFLVVIAILSLVIYLITLSL